jgi:hypothetical protein
VPPLLYRPAVSTVFTVFNRESGGVIRQHAGAPRFFLAEALGKPAKTGEKTDGKRCCLLFPAFGK